MPCLITGASRRVFKTRYFNVDRRSASLDGYHLKFDNADLAISNVGFLIFATRFRGPELKDQE